MCPENLASGSGHAVEELLGWLSKAALDKMGEKNNGKSKTFSRDGNGQRREEEKQQANVSGERGTHGGGGEGEGRLVRRGTPAVAGESATHRGRRAGSRWRGRKKEAAAEGTASSDASVDKPGKKKGAKESEDKSNGDDSKATAAPSDGSSSSRGRSLNTTCRRRNALPPEVVRMMATAVESSSAAPYSPSQSSESTSGCSCPSTCSCCGCRPRRRSACLYSTDDLFSNGGSSGGSDDAEEGQQASSGTAMCNQVLFTRMGRRAMKICRKRLLCSTNANTESNDCFPVPHCRRNESQTPFFLACVFFFSLVPLFLVCPSPPLAENLDEFRSFASPSSKRGRWGEWAQVALTRIARSNDSDVTPVDHWTVDVLLPTSVRAANAVVLLKARAATEETNAVHLPIPPPLLPQHFLRRRRLSRRRYPACGPRMPPPMCFGKLPRVGIWGLVR